MSISATTHAVNRVPHILFLYWVIKMASTTLGETGADMFSHTFGFDYGMTILIFFPILVFFCTIKLLFKRYEPITYWLAFTASAILGTANSDYIDRTLGLGYAGGSILLISALLLTLFIWHRKDKSLSVEVITTHSTEIFYWIAFLIGNTLGTALGDYVADELHIGFLWGAGIFGGLLITTAILHYTTRVSGVILFWIAFVLTRPLGATLGDLLTKPHNDGGLDLGTIAASTFFAVVLVIALIKEVANERKRNLSAE